MKLAEYLSKNQISQDEAGKAVSVSAGRIGHFSRGEDLPPPKICVRIEKWTGGQVSRRELRPNDYLDFWPELEQSSSEV